MSARVTVTTADGEVVAVKSASTPDQMTALAGEAARLQRAAHPGVVDFVEHRVTGGRAELSTRFAGEPLDRWRGTPAQAAGLVAAVAATVADLHDLGVVHGRIDGSHVLLDATGRPRLCGFTPSEDDPSPPDDVAALGRLLETLGGQAIPPRGARPNGFLWPRAKAADQRALNQVVAHATDPVPTRRPTARALARSILSAVPGAELAPVGQLSSESTERSESTEPTPGAPAGAAQAPDGFEVATPASIEQLDDPALGLDAGVDQIFGDQTTAEIDELFVDRKWDHPADREWTVPIPRPGRRPSHAARSGPRRRLPSPLAGAAVVVLLAVVAAGASAFRAGWPSDVGAQEPAVAPAPATARPCAPTDPPAASTADTTATAHTDDPTGPGVPTGEAVTPADTADTGGAPVPTGTADTPGATGTAGTAETTGTGGAPVPTGAADAVPAGEADTPLDVDVDGDGCPDPVVVADGVVQAAGQRWAVGEPGDAVAVGDWDCDGTATPAVYRPSSGDVFVFSDWAAVDQPLATEPVAQVLGGRSVATARREPDGPGCDRLSVQLVAGGQRFVDVTP